MLTFSSSMRVKSLQQLLVARSKMGIALEPATEAASTLDEFSSPNQQQWDRPTSSWSGADSASRCFHSVTAFKWSMVAVL